MFIASTESTAGANYNNYDTQGYVDDKSTIRPGCAVCYIPGFVWGAIKCNVRV